MTDQNSQKKLIEKIIANPNFSQSSIYPNLLKYLAECSKRGYTPKESDIAENVFAKKEFDSSADPLIRVHVSKLRKKLEKYFDDEGKDEEIKIVIPARHYSVEFKQNKPSTTLDLKKPLITWIVSIVACLIILINLFIYLNNATLIKQVTKSKILAKDNLIWSNFLGNKLPTIFAVGNVNTYCQYSEELQNYFIINNPLVNDRKALDDYIKEAGIPEHYIWEPVWEVLPKSALLNYGKLYWLFNVNETELITKLSTKMEWEDFRRNNIVYLGHFHNLGMLREFYNTQYIHSPHMEIDYQKRKALIKTDSLSTILESLKNAQRAPGALLSYLESDLQKVELTYPDMDTTLCLVASEKTKYMKDYVAISKLPGPNKNSLLFIISMHQIGRMEIVKMLTDPESYESMKNLIRQKTDVIPKYFEMVFEVEGFKETALKIELLHFYPIEEEFQFQ